MNKFASIAVAVSLAGVPAAALAAESSQSVRAATEEVAAPIEFSAGIMLYGDGGRRIANVYRVNENGDPQVILDGRMITIPASTLTDVDGKVTTSLTKREIARTR